MIHEEICTYEVCKLAKEKGLPQDECGVNIGYYAWDGCRNIHSLVNSFAWYNDEYNHDDLYLAPTQSLLQRWLRDKKEIHIEIGASACGYFWIADKTNGTAITDSDLLDLGTNNGGCFETYELALEDALKYAFQNLV